MYGGLIYEKDDPLALKKKIEIEDIIGLPLICSAQAMEVDILGGVANI